MKTIPNLILLSFLLFAGITAHAQETEYYTDIQKDIRMGKELYRQKKYNAAFRQFEKIQAQVDEKSELYSEAEFYMSVSALKAGHSSGGEMVEKFVDDYPESPYMNSAWLNLGDYQFSKRQYKYALKSFANVDEAGITGEEQTKLHYQLGYSYLMTEENDKAAAEFYQIKDGNSFYSKPASYYWAHIMYLDGKYEAALQGFTKLNGDRTYSKVIPLYVSHIYYKQGKYDEVINYTASIIDQVEDKQKPELSKILGDSYFHLNKFEEATPYLESYYYSSGAKPREDSYILGFCYYKAGKYDKAAQLLENASKGNDEMAQNAYYHLADSYIKLGEKEKARVAFGAASEMDFNERIKEDALFSYAKLTYELSYSPFNETIKAFDKYISLYPNSERNSEAYRYLVEVFMVTRNYNDAISSIEKIQNKTTSVLKAYQRVTFYRGLELFNNLAYNQAIDFFDISLQNGTYDRELKAKALYWKAEALYRVGDYSNSVMAYSRFLQTAGSYSLPEFKNAEYNLAYAYFKMEDYEAASSHFRKYINDMQGKRTEKLADALNRTGDYYYLNTNYSTALQYYQQSYNMKTYEADYALFQIAFCQGLERNQQQKISNLQRLLADFPESDYQDDALYELGRAFERLGQNSNAQQQYSRIVNDYPQGNYYRKAQLQLGLIFYNNGDYAQALAHYKKVAENFQGTEEAQAALLGIKNCYVELNNVDEYFSYAKRLGSGASVTTSEQDELSYQAAERAYMSGSAGAISQLQRYLQQFQDGKYTLNANFYLAEALYKDGKYTDANQHYTAVAMQPNNIFSEQALSRASELTYNAQDYGQALELFLRLGEIANSKWNVLKAYTGQMRCYSKLGQLPQAIAAAEKVKKSDIANKELTREAGYIIGKSYYGQNDLAKALPALKGISSDTKLEQGAEAKFLVAEIYFRQNKKAEAESEIDDFISKGTPYLFWLGKSFLLLSDIYIGNNQEFDAKHTLKSLIENYNNDTDGIKDEASRKLAKIEASEQKEQKEAIDNSLQLKINEN